MYTTTSSKTLKTSDGYCAKIMQIFQQKFGFKSILIKSTGFGNYKGNGKITGMVGVMAKDVRI